MTFYLRYLRPGFDSRHLHQLFTIMQKLFENWRGYLKETDADNDGLSDEAELTIHPDADVGQSVEDKNYYHVTRSENVPLIMRDGLLPLKPTDMEDVEGIYLFKSPTDAEEALMNWLGDRFDEEESLTLLKVDALGIDEVDSSAAGFEVVSTSKIDPQFISIEQENL